MRVAIPRSTVPSMRGMCLVMTAVLVWMIAPGGGARVAGGTAASHDAPVATAPSVGGEIPTVEVGSLPGPALVEIEKHRRPVAEARSLDAAPKAKLPESYTIEIGPIGLLSPSELEKLEAQEKLEIGMRSQSRPEEQRSAETAPGSGAVGQEQVRLATATASQDSALPEMEQPAQPVESAQNMEQGNPSDLSGQEVAKRAALLAEEDSARADSIATAQDVSTVEIGPAGQLSAVEQAKLQELAGQNPAALGPTPTKGEKVATIERKGACRPSRQEQGKLRSRRQEGR